MTIETDVADKRIELLAGLIAQELRAAAEGHCVRVDYLEHDEAEDVCRTLTARGALGQQRLLACVLAPHEGELTITADRAIELRNRKQGILCLFVPAGLVDAAISSLGNSFQQIDGRRLHEQALKKAEDALSAQAAESVRSVRGYLRGAASVSANDQLGFAFSAASLDGQGRLAELGLALWQVGLIVDARPDFDRYLTANLNAVRALARPQRLGATYRDRIATLKVNEDTALKLERFFPHRPLHDVRAWSRALIDAQLTFDRWVFPEIAETDIAAVTVKPFKDAHGLVLKTAKLSQPDGPGGSLLAPCGEKCAIGVRWETEPLKPRNVYAWRVSLEPFDEENEDDGSEAEFFDRPAREVKGSARTARLKLDLEFDEPPELPYCVRVAAIDETGNGLTGVEGKPIEGRSDEFYLTREQIVPKAEGTRRRQTSPTLAVARLEAALESREHDVALTQPAWSESRGIAYFTARVNERAIVNVALSPLLRRLQNATIGDPRGGGRWLLELDEVRPATSDEFSRAPLIADDEAWADFWRARATFFERLHKAAPRDTIEAADWTPELINAAMRHAQAYAALLEILPHERLREALSLDTLVLRLPGLSGTEQALVVLPTHPLRAAWFASHAALLRRWEERLLAKDRRERRRLVDLQLARGLVPSNMPAFVCGWESNDLYLFFRNLGVFHGVALPPDAPDPVRRYQEIALALSSESETAGTDADRIDRLARYLRDFRASHPYADPFAIALVNPDQGELIAAAWGRQFAPAAADDEPQEMPALEVTAYSFEGRQAGLVGLEQLRQQQEERRTRNSTDALQPALVTAVRQLDSLEASGPAPAHVALVSDVSSPRIQLGEEESEGSASSLSLYGLVARFLGSFSSDGEAIDWQYRIAAPPQTRLEQHPVAPRYGETLIDLQRALLRAQAQLQAPSRDAPMVPALQVSLSPDWARRLERLHEAADWVITLDRFFGIDYYDSPNESNLESVARKYLIDYAPEFVDGLGHRMIVTTASRDEVALILRRSMEDLGLAAIERSVGQLLHNLKTVSGRLALQVMGAEGLSSEAVSLGSVLIWLRAKRRLQQAVLVPIDPHAQLFGLPGGSASPNGQGRCDLALISMRRGAMEVSFIDVKWRRGPLGPIDDLVEEMHGQMQSTSEAWEERFFNPERVDLSVQRAYLATVLRFYCSRARRYGLLDAESAAAFQSYVAQFERTGATFRPRYEGFIISVEDSGRPPIVENEFTVTILTAKDLDVAIPPAVDSSGRTQWQTSAMPVPVRTQSQHEPDGTLVQTGEKGENSELVLDPVARAAAEEPDLTETAPLVEPSIVLGNDVNGEVRWTPSVKGSPHLFITGIPGQGKSVTITRLLSGLSAQEAPAVVFDFHGQFGAAGSPYVSRARPVVVDAAAGLPFSPFECSTDTPSASWKAEASNVAEIFSHVCDLGYIQRDSLYTCILNAYRVKGFGTEADSETREFPSLEDVLRGVEQAERQQNVHNLVARCRPLLEMDIFRPSANGEERLAQAMQRGLVVDLHNLPSEMLQLAAGAFLLRKIYRDMFRWGEAKRLRLALVLDEAHRLARDVTLPKIIKEGRKFGIAVVVASQGIADFHADVINNAGTKVAFRANHAESRKIAGFFRGRAGQDLATTLESLPVGSALVQTPEMPFAARVRMLSSDDA